MECFPIKNYINLHYTCSHKNSWQTTIVDDGYCCELPVATLSPSIRNWFGNEIALEKWLNSFLLHCFTLWLRSTRKRTHKSVWLTMYDEIQVSKRPLHERFFQYGRLGLYGTRGKEVQWDIKYNKSFKKSQINI